MKWVISYASLFVEPKLTSVRFCYMPVGAIVEPSGQNVLVDGVPFSEVFYKTSDKTFLGWAYSYYLEELVNEFPVGVVPTSTQTPSPNDPAQDIIWLGNVQYNLCGEFCVAYIAKDSIENILTKWQPKSPSVFNRIFSGGRSRPTGAGDVQDMLRVYSLSGTDINGFLYDPIRQAVILSPARLAAVINQYRAIVGVKIDGYTGNLRGQGVGHWVCIEKVVPDGVSRGWVEFYNPFPNQMQRESWSTFISSMGIPYGLAVHR